jgi:raffinose/stachyose/melibiose transport system permease protein
MQRQTLFKVTIPMMMPSITICTFLTITNGFKLFDQNLALTGGAPMKKTEMLALNIYNTFYGRVGFEGVGQAKAVIFFVLVVAIAAVQQKLTKNKGGSAVMEKKGKWYGTTLLTFLCVFWIFPVVCVLMELLQGQDVDQSEAVRSCRTERTFVKLGELRGGDRKVRTAEVGGLDRVYHGMFGGGDSDFLQHDRMVCHESADEMDEADLCVLCIFSMVVPFQMVMFTLSLVSEPAASDDAVGNDHRLSRVSAPGLAVFMFTGFVRSIPIEIEEAALIDGCTPVQTFFKVVLPIMKPTYISVGILETMWIWNDFPAAVSGAGHQEVQDDLHYHSVHEGKLRIGRYGSDHGGADHGGDSGRHLLPELPEVHHQGCRGRSGEGLIIGAHPE